MKRAVIPLLALLCARSVAGQAMDLPTEFSTCFDDTNFCIDAPLDTMELAPVYSCGETFYRFAGRLAFPVLRNVGPITISLKTMGLSPQLKRFPLYVEIRYRAPDGPLECTTFLAGSLVMIAEGLPFQCGGVWESVTLDLTRLGIPANEAFHVQITGFKWFRVYDSPGLACVRVTAADTTTAVHIRTWGFVKDLYR